MEGRDSDGAKLIVLPNHLVERLRAMAVRKGVSLSSYAVEALEQALRAEGMGSSPREAVDLFRLMLIQRGVGAIHLPRSSLEQLVGLLYPEGGEELRRIWREAGRWYGEYLRTKLRDGNILGFLERALLVSWDLDEAEIRNDEEGVTLRCTSFLMALETTELLVSYVSGAMDSLGYEEVNRDYLRGMATLRFRKSINR